MLNLVQLQERLKDVPMQALMQYANGGNPQVPPFLALGELNRRKKMQESAAAEKAQEMEGAPSIKDQIEQSAGLLALQGNRQKQAAQQQQGIQAAMPMAAPNTTTSEPAQMAAGGAIDDIVVPRDYQAGGQVSPDMLKKLMMLKAMKQKQGVAGLSTRPDMFRRGDYAGGGIVAFDGGGSVFNRIDTSDTMRKKAEQYRELLRSLFGRKSEVSPSDQAEMLRVSPTEEPVLPQAEYSNEGRAYERGRPGALNPATEGPMAPRRAEPTETVPAPLRPAAPAAKPGPGIASLFSRFNLPKTEDLSDEERLKRVRDLQRMAGVKENPFADIEERYKNIEAEDLKQREGQPMDRLVTFLSGVAEGRGGNWATQGARGAKASMALEAQQNASNRKQDMDMAALRMSMAKEADARARGDVAAVMKEKENQEKLKLDLAKLQSEDEYRSGSLDVQRQQAESQRMQALKPTQLEQLQALMRSKDPNDQALARLFLGASKTGEITDAKLLDQWNDLSLVDKSKLAKMTPPVTTFEQYKAYIRGTTGGTASGGKTIDFSQLPK